MNSLNVCWLCDPWKFSREKYIQAWVNAGWKVILWIDYKWNITTPPHPIGEAPYTVSGAEIRNAQEIVKDSPIERAYRYAVHHTNHGTASDLFRYEILCQLGGAYADLDVWPGPYAKPVLLGRGGDPLFGHCTRSEVEIRFIITQPNHPLMIQLRDKAVENEEKFIDAGGWLQKRSHISQVLYRTGPGMAIPVVKAYAKEHGKKLTDFILLGAVDEATIEGTQEHFTHKQAAVKRIAKTMPFREVL